MHRQPEPLIHPRARIVVLLAWMGLIFAVSSRPSVPAPAGDITPVLGHFSVYFVLAILVWWALGIFMLNPGLRLALAWLLAVLYGVSDEWHQSFVPGRTPDVMDIVVDGIGAATGLLLVWLIVRQRPATWSDRR